MKLGMEVGLGPGHIVLDGDPSPPFQERERSPLQITIKSPPFSAHLYCDQTARWIKMPLGMELCLGAGHIVLDGDPALSPIKGETAPEFSAHVCCGQTVVHLSYC